MTLFCAATAESAKKARQSFADIDECLLTRIACDDMEALRALYDATHKGLYAFALSITGNAEDSKDALQETYLKIRSSAHLYKPHGKPMAWIITILKNECFMILRKNARAFGSTEEEGYDLFQVERVEDKAVLRAALSILDETEREIVLLHAVTGMLHREIAKIVGLKLS
ncbi:MAG: RNA polymerase sigma factor, partial [Oscillospiraceae bacterium]